MPMNYANNMTKTKKLALIALLVAQATILHIVEGMLPNPLPLPGVKLGLANIITLLCLVIFDFKIALQVAILRTIFGSLLGGTLFGMGFLMSFSGTLMATFMMAILLRFFQGFSIIGISIAGAAAHNLGQLIIAALVIETSGIFLYLPFMLMFSLPTGFITGLITKELVKYIQGNTQSSNTF